MRGVPLLYLLLGTAIFVPSVGAVVIPDVSPDQLSPDPDPEQPVTPDDVTGKIGDAGNNFGGGGPKAPAAPGSDRGIDKIGSALTEAITENWAMTGLITLGLAGAGLASFALASRWVDPKEALRNPQRSMLYGFIKGNPGVHLKQLSNEFRMKTSTVLWHIRKLEHADLVRSKKANGYRVFYPVSGGLEAKQLSTAVTALSNHNAKSVFEFVAINPGAHRRVLSGRLMINPGTIRWHLKKLREAGLVAELAQDRFSTYYATDLGLKAMRQVATLPANVTAPTIEVAALPTLEAALDEEPEPVLAA